MTTPHARPTSGTGVLVCPCGSLLRASRSSGSELGTRRRSSTTGTTLLVSVRMTFLLFLLGDGLRGEGLGSMQPISSSPSCSCSGGAPDSVHDQSAGHSSCLLSWFRGGANCAENRRVFASAVPGTPCALCLVRQWIHVLRQLRGAFERFFYVMVVLGSCRESDSQAFCHPN